jgi:hypothetical protein
MYKFAPQKDRSNTPSALLIPIYGKNPKNMSPAAYLLVRLVISSNEMTYGKNNKFDIVNMKNAPILRPEANEGEKIPLKTRLPVNRQSRIK